MEGYRKEGIKVGNHAHLNIKADTDSVNRRHYTRCRAVNDVGKSMLQVVNLLLSD